MKAITWHEGKVRILDQSQLPRREVYRELTRWPQVARAIKGMKVRGAPALGVAAAYGLALAARNSRAATRDALLEDLERAAEALAATRPTAVNLRWGLERLRKVALSRSEVEEVREAMLAEARRIEAEDEEANRNLGKWGAELLEDGATVLTHCNAGALATAGYGTALGVVRAAREAGKRVLVYVTETRPLLQGARLTTWELQQEGIPVVLITDSMAGYFMRKGVISYVLVGADRIAANGDTANKIGTYTLAVLAMEHGLPFYVAAPLSTVDLSLPSGEGIPIEERSPEEVTRFRGIRIAPEGVRAANPAFDVTPHHYISAIITEKGVVREPYQVRLRKLITGENQ